MAHTCLHYHHNELFIEDVSLTQVAEQFGTPCYVYSRNTLETNWRQFDNAFRDIPHLLCYAVKANSNIAILHLFAQMQSGFDIVSAGELERVLLAGGDLSKVVFSGVGKQERELRRAIEANIFCLDVESEAELIRLDDLATKMNKKVKIAFRVNPDIDPGTHAHIATGLKENKFGIESDEVVSLYKKLTSMTSLQLIGLASHIGSQMVDLDPIMQALDRLLNLYTALQKLGANITHINIGGGLGISYHHENPPAVKTYASALQKKLAPYPITLIMEPGRAIVGNAGVLLTRVEYLKHNNYRNFAIVDAGMNDLLRPALYDAWQEILPVMSRESIEAKQYDIAGPVCESTDILGKNRKLTIQSGDLLAIDAVGAYGFSMSSNYNSRGRAAEVMIDGNKAFLIRKRETIQELVALENIDYQ